MLGRVNQRGAGRGGRERVQKRSGGGGVKTENKEGEEEEGREGKSMYLPPRASGHTYSERDLPTMAKMRVYMK